MGLSAGEGTSFSSLAGAAGCVAVDASGVDHDEGEAGRPKAGEGGGQVACLVVVED